MYTAIKCSGNKKKDANNKSGRQKRDKKLE